jgi:ankyrin repeat protein
LVRVATALLLALAWSSLAFCGPIHDLARKGDLNKIKALVKDHPELISSRDKSGNTPLHLAAFHGNPDVVAFLLANGADVNAKNNYPIFAPGDLEGMFGAHSANQTDPVILLTAHGVAFNTVSNGYTPLDLALFSFKHKDTVDMLLAKGADVNATAASGTTPLFWAIMRGQKDDVTLLLAKGANLNAKDAYENSMLHIAVRMGYRSIVELLLNKGADVNAKDQRGRTPFSYALEGTDETMIKLLRSHGAKE